MVAPPPAPNAGAYGMHAPHAGHGYGYGYVAAPNGPAHPPYASPPAGYGAPPGGYGAPTPYGAPPVVHGFGGAAPFQYGQPVVTYQQNPSRWTSGWSTLFWIRLGVAAIAIGVSLIGACVSALSQ